MHVVALIVAAGRGTRAGEGLPKQYRPVGGTPILARTLSAFCGHPGIKSVLTVIHPDDQPHYEKAAGDLPKLLPPVAGRATRQASVFAGLEALADIDPTHVLIHDGARPFAASDMISRVVAGLEHYESVLPSLSVTDTLREQVDGVAGETVDRSKLVRAQTPQGFAYKAILDAHRTHQSEEFTDDVALALRSGIHTQLVDGSEDNFKVTTPEDFDRAERFLSASNETRSGSGFDVHRFTGGDKVTLCGVSVPHSQSLLGHSDADVGLHAITDALLGAISAGDIGDHFPPSDAQWKGTPSRVFLEHAGTLLAKQSGQITNVDVTLICEAPKIGAHREAMRTAIAEIVGVSKDRISVKATTTEGLGFTGRGEGIAAQALVTVTLPRSAGTE